MVFAGILPWAFFASSLADGSNSLVANAHLINKVYFPRLIIPTANLAVAFVDFLITFCMLIAMMAWYRLLPAWQVVFIPIFMLLGGLASVGPALWIASLNVKYRDFRFVTPFIIQFGLYVSPVGFSSSVVPDQWRLLYSLNPMVAVIDGFRWCILGGQSPLYWPSVVLGTCVAGFFLWFGINRFRKMEKDFADLM
jgi:lipopolysaccharide transport system permease protein